MSDPQSTGSSDPFSFYRDPNPMRGWEEQQRASLDKQIAVLREANAEKERQRQQVGLRENRLAAIAEAAHAREVKAEKRNEALLIIAIATLVVSIVAAAASVLALTR